MHQRKWLKGVEWVEGAALDTRSGYELWDGIGVSTLSLSWIWMAVASENPDCMPSPSTLVRWKRDNVMG